MPCGWESNRSSEVALATRRRLQWSIHLRAHGLRKETCFSRNNFGQVVHTHTEDSRITIFYDQAERPPSWIVKIKFLTGDAPERDTFRVIAPNFAEIDVTVAETSQFFAFSSEM